MANTLRPTDRAGYMLSRLMGMGMLLLVVVATSVFAAGYSAQIERTSHTPAATVGAGHDPTKAPTTMAPRPAASTQSGPAVVGGSMPGVGVGIWLDDRGRPVPPPPGGGQALIRAAIGAGTVLIAGGALLAGLWYATRRITTRRTLRRWELEWQRVGPEWSRRAQ